MTYLTNDHIDLSQLEEGMYLYFEMPSMCSGEYKEKIFRDEKGFYVEKFWDRAEGLSLTPYWSKEYQ